MKWGTKNFPEQLLKSAHAKSLYNIDAARQSTQRGCFCCCKIFTPDLVEGHTADDGTIFCPFCDMDSVLADADVPEATQRSFLYEMNVRYSGGDSEVPFDLKLFE